jgi:electron transfer flavoprotein alpha subunit
MSASDVLPGAHPVAVIVCRAGQPPVGADEAVAEVGGLAIVAGQGAREAAAQLTAAYRVWTVETPPGLQVARLARRLARLVVDSPLVVLPASADGRDLAPRLAALLDRPLLAGATSVGVVEAPVGETAEVLATLTRLDNRLALPVRVPAPVVATLPPGVRSVTPVGGAEVIELPPPARPEDDGTAEPLDVQVIEVLEPDAATMDLAEAPRVVAGGAGLLPPGADEATGRAVFEVLADVAAALGASTGATRVVTDAGWMGFDRQIGTTGITLDPDLYLAFAISGAVQHTGGIGTPAHVVSINTDASCPMTSMATLGLVTDARALLSELARRLGVEIPAQAGLPTSDRPAGSDSAEGSDSRDTTEEVPA